MHYIRFLKSPRFVGSGNEKALVAKITVTTDLGESFLAADVGISVDVVAEDGESIIGPGREYVWKGRDGMRSLEVSLLMKKVRKLERIKMVVAAKGDAHVDRFEKVLGIGEKGAKNEGGIVTVRSVKIDSSTGHSLGAGLAERVFSSDDRADPREIHIWEETGESIARHVWDAGLVLSSYIATPRHLKTSPLPRLPLLETSLSQPKLNILELGAGCGIVSITLLHTLSTLSQILLTDLPEASAILTHNLSPAILHHTPSKISHQVLDWSLPLPSNVAATKWDLVFVADCTYNPDVVPDLVATLGRIAEGNGQVRVVVAMKVRHESEMVLFGLMEEAGFVVKEKGVVPLPVLGGEDEEIEIFVFAYSS